MATQERVYTADDVWQLEQQPLNPTEKYYLIDGELMIKMAPAQHHASAASELSRHLGNFVAERGLGRVLTECGYHPAGDRRTVLLPDVAFEAMPRASQPPLATYVPYMPDLAVEIISPSQTLAQVRRKAEVYLRHGAAVVWLLDPLAKTAEVWRRGADDAPVVERIAGDGDLTGGDILPGFRLPLARIFSN
ncbi:MAG: Uma2 family endonuclease [Chloroflexota bacterium]|nr:Uma2 family endonuclease [Chloroflexota bacterium]